MIKDFIKNHVAELSSLGLIFGILLIYLSGVGVFFPKSASGFVKDFLNFVGDWKYWIFLLSIGLILAGGGYLYSFLKDRKEFKELIDTGSKATFVRNQDDIEYLAWNLGQKYEAIVQDKKKEFKIKT